MSVREYFPSGEGIFIPSIGLFDFTFIRGPHRSRAMHGPRDQSLLIICVIPAGLFAAAMLDEASLDQHRDVAFYGL